MKAESPAKTAEKEEDDKTVCSSDQEELEDENKTVIPAEDTVDVAEAQENGQEEDEFEKKSDNELGEELKQALFKLAVMNEEDEAKASQETVKALEEIREAEGSEDDNSKTSVLVKEEPNSACPEVFEKLTRKNWTANISKELPGEADASEPRKEPVTRILILSYPDLMKWLQHENYKAIAEHVRN